MVGQGTLFGCLVEVIPVFVWLIHDCAELEVNGCIKLWEGSMGGSVA